MTATGSPTPGGRRTRQRGAMRASLLLRVAPLLLVASCGAGAPATVADARKALEAGDPATARVLLLKRIQAAPDDRVAHLMLADILIGSGDGVGAEQTLTAAERLAPLGPDERGLLAESLFLQGRCDRMGDTVEAGLGAVARVRALCRIEAGDIPGARAIVDQGLARDPQSVPLLAMKARMTLLGGDPRGAMTLAKQVLAREPRSLDALMVAGAAAEAGEDPDAAAGWYERAARAAPANLAPWSAKAALAARRSDKAGLDAAIAALGERAPDSWQHRLARVRLALVDKDAERAVSEWNALLPVMPDRAERALLAGEVAALTGNMATAVTELSRYVAANPAHVPARLALADAQGKSGDPAAATATLRPIAARPDAPRPVLVAMAGHARAAGAADADQFTARAAAPDPQRLLAILRRAETAMAQRQWARAIALYQGVDAELGRPNAVILNNLGLAQVEAGDVPGGIATLRRAATAAPTNASVLDSLGWALWSTGTDRAEGRRLVERARTLAPGNAAIAEHARQVTY